MKQRGVIKDLVQLIKNKKRMRCCLVINNGKIFLLNQDDGKILVEHRVYDHRRVEVDGKWRVFPTRNGIVQVYNRARNKTWKFDGTKNGLYELDKRDKTVAVFLLVFFVISFGLAFICFIHCFYAQANNHLGPRGEPVGPSEHLSMYKRKQPPEGAVVFKAGTRIKSLTELDKNEGLVIGMMTNCNLVLFSHLWEKTLFAPISDICLLELFFQEDGNLVLYNFTTTPVWSTNTHGKGYTEMWFNFKNKNFEFN